MVRLAVRFITLVLVLFGSAYANAQTEPIGGWFSPRQGTDRGTYACTGGWQPCEVQGNLQTPAPNNQGMITSVINGQLATPIWRKGDYFTICNSGGMCTTFTYDGFGNWLATGNSPDNGQYHGDTARPKPLVSADQYSPSCSASGVVEGHYEWNDYYSNDQYIGSGELTWVVTGVSVQHQCV